jgi:opacity protein-like surface antigen
MRKMNHLALLALLSAALSQVAAAQADPKIGFMVEGGMVWQNRNDIRVPNATGTLFSLPDVIGSGGYGVFRAEVDFKVAARHGFRLVFAPLRITDTGTLPGMVSFAGEAFSPDTRTDATYKFSNYRLTYRYDLYQGNTWTWRIGATGFIRDAKIALSQNGVYAEDTDVGFVPLVYLQGIARIGEDWRFLFDFDGLAAAQGRAFDIAAKLSYSLSDHVSVDFGYRTIEGGADVEQVYNFAWLNAATGALRLQF